MGPVINFKLKGESLIEDWLLKAAEVNFEFTDIHIDQITRISKYGSDWIEKSVDLFQKASILRHSLFDDDNLILFLCIPMRDFRKKQKLQFRHVNELKKYLNSWTPPSFYIERKSAAYYQANFASQNMPVIRCAGRGLSVDKLCYFREGGFVHHLYISDEGL